METKLLSDLASEIDEGLRSKGRCDTEALQRYYAAAQEAFDGGDAEEVFALVRIHLGRFEEALTSMGCSAEADAVYVRKMELHRQLHIYRRKRGGGFRYAYLALGYFWWRLTSNYGVSPLRVVWAGANVALVFSFIYFFLDVLSFYNTGRLAFADGVILGPISYFLVGLQGLFPGSVFQIAAVIETQIAITVENILGGIVILMLFAALKRRYFRVNN